MSHSMCDASGYCLEGLCHSGRNCTASCSAREACVHQICVTAAITVGRCQCGADMECKGGVCVPRPCSAAPCQPSTHLCHGGRCLRRCHKSPGSCPAGQACQELPQGKGAAFAAACVEVCAPGCKPPAVCQDQRCVTVPDACNCPKGESCQAGTGSKLLTTLQAEIPFFFISGKCIRLDVCVVGSNKHCPAGQACSYSDTCKEYHCIPGKCGGGKCPPGLACVGSQCLARCEETGFCPVGQTCKEAGGQRV